MRVVGARVSVSCMVYISVMRVVGARVSVSCMVYISVDVSMWMRMCVDVDV